MPENLYHYCIREDSIINNFNEKRLTETVARKRVIEVTGNHPMAKVQYVQSVIELIYAAGQHGKVEYLLMLRKEAMRYFCMYFFSPKVGLKQKIRSVAIILNPQIAYLVWTCVKRKLGLTWWHKEINR